MIHFMAELFRLIKSGNPQAVFLFIQICQLVVVITFLLGMIEIAFQPVASIRFWFWKRKYAGKVGMDSLPHTLRGA